MHIYAPPRCLPPNHTDMNNHHIFYNLHTYTHIHNNYNSIEYCSIMYCIFSIRECDSTLCEDGSEKNMAAQYDNYIESIHTCTYIHTYMQYNT